MKNNLKIKIKKLSPDAVIPEYSTLGSAGMDLTAVSVEYDDNHNVVTYKTGLSIEIPKGYVGLLFPRSSVYKLELTLSNCVGIIDSDYRGEIMFKFRINIDCWTESSKNYEDFQSSLEKGEFKFYETARDEHRDWEVFTDIYKVGDRVGQLIILPYPQIEFEEVDELSETERGSGGYGSTGN